ncbi:MAG: hypothetical protein PHU25_01180 [Deltaproteobacteria bacterium]|nr:hypothetical protein [Deltaproteobacteria bacterium]
MNRPDTIPAPQPIEQPTIPKVLNGRINDCGVIIPRNDTMDIIYNGAEDSLLFRQFRSGNVTAEIDLAEFDDGLVACSASVNTPYSGCSSPMTPDDRADRETAIADVTSRIIRSLENTIADTSSGKPKTVNDNCRALIGQLRAWNFRSSGMTREEEPPALPLAF